MMKLTESDEGFLESYCNMLEYDQTTSSMEHSLKELMDIGERTRYDLYTPHFSLESLSDEDVNNDVAGSLGKLERVMRVLRATGGHIKYAWKAYDSMVKEVSIKLATSEEFLGIAHSKLSGGATVNSDPVTGLFLNYFPAKDGKLTFPIITQRVQNMHDLLKATSKHSDRIANAIVDMSNSIDVDVKEISDAFMKDIGAKRLSLKTCKNFGMLWRRKNSKGSTDGLDVGILGCWITRTNNDGVLNIKVAGQSFDRPTLKIPTVNEIKPLLSIGVKTAGVVRKIVSRKNPYSPLFPILKKIHKSGDKDKLRDANFLFEMFSITNFNVIALSNNMTIAAVALINKSIDHG